VNKLDLGTILVPTTVGAYSMNKGKIVGHDDNKNRYFVEVLEKGESYKAGEIYPLPYDFAYPNRNAIYKVQPETFEIGVKYRYMWSKNSYKPVQKLDLIGDQDGNSFLAIYAYEDGVGYRILHAGEFQDMETE
jgi:hypothetical protein